MIASCDKIRYAYSVWREKVTINDKSVCVCVCVCVRCFLGERRRILFHWIFDYSNKIARVNCTLKPLSEDPVNDLSSDRGHAFAVEISGN